MLETGKGVGSSAAHSNMRVAMMSLGSTITFAFRLLVLVMTTVEPSWVQTLLASLQLCITAIPQGRQTYRNEKKKQETM